MARFANGVVENDPQPKTPRTVHCARAPGRRAGRCRCARGRGDCSAGVEKNALTDLIRSITSHSRAGSAQMTNQTLTIPRALNGPVANAKAQSSGGMVFFSNFRTERPG